jgi:hypothetical protein
VSIRVTLTGFDELLKQMADAPREIREEAMERVRFVTESAANEMRAGYGRHRVTGNLVGSVKTTYPSDDVIVGIAHATAPHAHLFQWGTKKRRNASGANRGRMPVADQPNVVDLARRWRQVLKRDLMAMMERLGFQVIE